MKNIKINGEAIKKKVIKGLQNTLGATHLILQSSADATAKLESKLCTPQGTNPELVFRARYYKTAKTQLEVREAFLLAKIKSQTMLDGLYKSSNIKDSLANECIR